MALQYVSVADNADGTYTIANNGSTAITGVTLLAEDTIRAATLDGQPLVSFGGTYGDKELVLPSLAPGQSARLMIAYTH